MSSQNNELSYGTPVTNYRQSKKKEEDSSLCGVFLICCGCISALALVAGAIAYIVFGIMFLVQDYDVAHDCGGSSLWAYVLTALILAWSRGSAKNAQDDNNQVNFCVLICLGLIEGGLAIWGGIELFGNSCDDLSESNLWTFGLVTFILQTFVASICLVIIPLLVVCCECCCSYCEKKEHEDNSNNV